VADGRGAGLAAIAFAVLGGGAGVTPGEGAAAAGDAAAGICDREGGGLGGAFVAGLDDGGGACEPGPGRVPVGTVMFIAARPLGTPDVAGAFAAGAFVGGALARSAAAFASSSARSSASASDALAAALRTQLIASAISPRAHIAAAIDSLSDTSSGSSSFGAGIPLLIEGKVP
jgi:hypothetical protein